MPVTFVCNGMIQQITPPGLQQLLSLYYFIILVCIKIHRHLVLLISLDFDQ